MPFDLLASLPAKDADAASLAIQFAIYAVVAACVAARKPLLAALRSAGSWGRNSTSQQPLAAGAPSSHTPPQPALFKHASSRGKHISRENRP